MVHNILQHCDHVKYNIIISTHTWTDDTSIIGVATPLLAHNSDERIAVAGEER